MPVRYCTWALCLVLAAVAASPASGQQAPQNPPGDTHGYIVFVRGAAVGREDVSIRTDASGITILSRARLVPPLDYVSRRAELHFAPDWTPKSLTMDATANGTDLKLTVSFENGSAVWDGMDGDKPIFTTVPMTAQTYVLPTMFFGAYEALAHRLATASAGTELRAMSGPAGGVPFRVVNVVTEKMQVGTEAFDVRRYELRFTTPAGELSANVTIDGKGSFVRLYGPAQELDVVRDDLASAASRTSVFTNPGDEALLIPGAGFNIGATLTAPRSASPKAAAVVLVSGSGANDRDGSIAGIPIVGQLAGALSEAGFLTVRFDRRGFGQSGGRAESATLGDAADDVLGIVRWLGSRKDVDPRRIAVVGHGDGAWVALLAASRDKRIASVVSLAGPSTTGEELMLEQQTLALSRMDVSQADRDEKIAMQKKIQAAVVSGGSWAGIPPEMRRQADTPWFQSLLTFDPSKTVKNVRQPVLLLHGELDRQVPIAHAERLADATRKNSKSKSVELISVKGVNHLLVPAVTGEVNEYATLSQRTVSRDVTSSIASWLTKSFGARP